MMIIQQSIILVYMDYDDGWVLCNGLPKPALSYDVTPENTNAVIASEKVRLPVLLLQFCENSDFDGGVDAEADLAATAMTAMAMVMMMMMMMTMTMTRAMTMTMMMMMRAMRIDEESSRFRASCASTSSTPCMFSLHGLLTASKNLSSHRYHHETDLKRPCNLLDCHPHISPILALPLRVCR